MILNKKFIFVRHGQTDHNISKDENKGDHVGHIPLNATGENQAQAIEPIIASLPVQTICTSPMKRAQQTKEIISARLQANHHTIENLSECTSKVWKEMARLGMYSSIPEDGEVRLFMDRIKLGMREALSLPGFPMIVAHGGVHWALCCLMQIEKHEWHLDNCGIVCFSKADNGQWIAEKIN